MKFLIVAFLFVGIVGVGLTAGLQSDILAPAAGRPATVVTPTELYSDDEFATIELRVVRLSDLATVPSPEVRLAPGIHVIANDSKSLTIDAVPVAFSKVQVADGPAKGRWGWLPTATLSRPPTSP